MSRPSTELSDVITRTQWYVRLRWYVLLAIVLPGLISVYLTRGTTADFWVDVAVSALAFLSNGIFLLLCRLYRTERYHRLLAGFIMAVDIGLVTYLIYGNGGIESRNMIVYALPIIASAVIFGRLAVFAATAVSILAYDFIIVANYNDLLHSPNSITQQAYNLPYVWNTLIFFSIVLLVIGVLADYLTQLLLAKEQQTRRSAEALIRAQAVARMGSWEWNLTTDRLTWSGELARMFDMPGYSPRATFHTYLERVLPADRKRVRSMIEQSIEELKPFSFEHRVGHSRTTALLVHCEGQVVLDEQGRPAYIYGTARDMTDDRALENAKNDFVSLASHQLRTPATGVKMLLSLLTGGYVGKLTDEQLGVVTQAYEANERQLRVANDLLNVAYAEAGRLTLRKRSIDLRDCISRAVAEQLPIVTKREQHLAVELPAKAVRAVVDADRLYLVMENLISNASKYTPTGGDITVSLSTTASHYQIAVTDTGIGIPKNQISKLFHRFSRIDNQLSGEAGGSGLGLYLTKLIVELHKGEIQVHSTTGQGSTFTVLLPRVLSKPKTT